MLHRYLPNQQYQKPPFNPKPITTNVVTQLVPIQNQNSGNDAIPNAPLLQNFPANESSNNSFDPENFIKAMNPKMYNKEKQFDSVLNIVEDEINKNIKKTKNKKTKICLTYLKSCIILLHFIGIFITLAFIMYPYFSKSEKALIIQSNENHTLLAKSIADIFHNMSKHSQPFILLQNATVLKFNDSIVTQKKKTQKENNNE
ncbi:unknown [Gryllus bimaculatus nudivirus]|uniref:Transmembrane protein n=1 Tax=Gryllus bimaculatus nudivirus TaxID=432587 RepID=A4L233_9VIRU|nr:hypothetical protein GrBNV_gp70 [Gryllus bimaculatus nudivirus]ABO45403.1 unknown [Gryllus bimaculatus nudivirus]